MRSPINFVGNSLAASDYSEWIPRPPGATRFSIGIGWPATGTPIGVLSVEASNSNKAATARETIYTASTNPAGTSDSVVIDNVVTSCAYVLVRYTRTSGGTAAVFTDDQNTTGAKPIITWMEG